MREITVLGGGLAGLAFIENLRGRGCTDKITLIDKNIYSLDKAGYIDSLSYKEAVDLKEFCAKNKVEYINGTVEKVNPKRKKIYLKDSGDCGFDVLIVAAGLKSQDLEIKGSHREGFFYLSGLDSYKIRDLLRFNDDATVFTSTILGLKLAVSLNLKDKNVRVVAANLDFLGQEKERLLSCFKEYGIDVYTNCAIEEAIGEGLLKAIKLTPLKVFPSQLFFVDSGFKKNLSFFEEGLTLKNLCLTEYDNVFILGEVCFSRINDQFYIPSKEEVLRLTSSFCNFFIDAKPFEFSEKEFSHQDKQNLIDTLLKLLVDKKTAEVK